MAILAVVIFGIFAIKIKKNQNASSTSFSLPVFGFVQNIWRYHHILSLIKAPTFADNACVITDYGAVADKKTLNTEAIRAAIEDCANKGGGKVVVPAGKFRTGPIRLMSGINLDLAEGSTLSFSDDRSLYLPPVFSRYQGMEYYNFSPMIYGKDLENIALTGKGELDGNGSEWVEWGSSGNEDFGRDKLIKMSKEGVPVEQRVFGEEGRLRPSFIQFINSKNILLEGITVKDSPFWTIHPVYCENITIRKIKVDTKSMNSDGIVVDSSRDVLIEDSKIRSGDDAIAIKSGFEYDGWRVGKPSENIIIRNMDISEGHAGVAFGSEMSGDIRSVIFRDSIVRNTDTGINMKSLPGRGGTIENIWLYHITFAPVEIGLKLNMDYETEVQSNTKHLPIFKNILISRIRMAADKEAVSIKGLGDKQMEDIDIVNLRSNTSENTIEDAGIIGVSFSDL